MYISEGNHKNSSQVSALHKPTWWAQKKVSTPKSFTDYVVTSDSKKNFRIVTVFLNQTLGMMKKIVK